MRSVVSIPKQAAEEAQENPKVAELKERLINAYPRLFSGVTNENPPDRGTFGTARIKLKPNPKIYRHREYQLQGDRAEAMKKLLAEFIERGEAGSDPRGHLGVTWGVYLCAGKPPLADIILSHPPDLTRCDSVIGWAIPAMSGHIQYRGTASGDLYIGISGINRVLIS